MSGSGTPKLARPDAMVEAGFLYFTYCGGSGAGACLTPTGVTGVVIPYRVPKTITRNMRIIFENREYFGVRMYTDAGSNGLCPNSIGVEQPFYLALSADGLLTDAQVIAQGVQCIGPAPYEIEFKENRIPQPKSTAWNNRIYLHVVWGNAGYINSLGDSSDLSHLPTENSFKIVKHDYEINN